jgi:hypothetical protein
MKVSVKSFDVDMELKNKGVELEIREADGTFVGDLVITKTKLIWCQGKTTRENGKEMPLPEFIEMMNKR